MSFMRHSRSTSPLRPPSVSDSLYAGYTESIYPTPETMRGYQTSSPPPTFNVSADRRKAWQDVSRAVLTMDNKKIKGCKDDIDTLLVFAGLFSAVLSAFLVESYKQLQPDNSSEIVALLRQSLTQSYAVSPPFINSTLVIDTVPAFEAPMSAVHVNALWFASLICSLATASIAMFVKQWLREYGEMSYVSPRDQLRAWQYRFPALDDWRVFDIAAALPLLLHVSLGLFFAGLCVFTAAVDRRIGHTTLPLTLGWVAFVLATVISPFISPRCPYNVPLLRVGQTIGRKWFFRPMLSSIRIRDVAEEIDAIKEQDTNPRVLLTIDRVLTDDGLVDYLAQTLMKETTALKDVNTFIRGIFIHRIGLSGEILLSIPPVLFPFTLNRRLLTKEVWDPCMDMLAKSLGILCSMSKSLGLKQITADTDESVCLFLRLAHCTYPLTKPIMDLFNSDQNVQTFLESFSHSSLRPEYKASFLCSVAQIRWKWQEPSTRELLDTSISIPWSDLYNLSHNPNYHYVWRPLLGTMLDVLQTYKPLVKEQQANGVTKVSTTRIVDKWVLDAAMTLLAHASYFTSSSNEADKLPTFLQELLEAQLVGTSDGEEPAPMGYTLALRIRSPDRSFKPPSGQLLHICRRSAARSQPYLLNVLHMYSVLLDLEAGSQPLREPPVSLQALMQSSLDSATSKGRNVRIVLADLWEFIHGYVVTCIRDSQSIPLVGLEDVFNLFWASIAFDLNQSQQRKYVELWRSMLTPVTALTTWAVCLRALFPVEEPLRGIDLSSGAMIASMFNIFKPDDGKELSSITSMLEKLADANEKVALPLIFNPLRLCLMYLRFYARISPVKERPPVPLEIWANLWLVVIRHIRLYGERPGPLSKQDRDVHLAHECVAALERVFPTGREFGGVPQEDQPIVEPAHGLIPRLESLANFLKTNMGMSGPQAESKFVAEVTHSSAVHQKAPSTSEEATRSFELQDTDSRQTDSVRTGTSGVINAPLDVQHTLSGKHSRDEISESIQVDLLISESADNTGKPASQDYGAFASATAQDVGSSDTGLAALPGETLPDSLAPILFGFVPAEAQNSIPVESIEQDEREDDMNFFLEGDDPSYASEYPNHGFREQWNEPEDE